MHPVILRNSIAGRGAGRIVVDALVSCLRDGGHDPILLDVNISARRDERLVSALQQASVLIIAGGDGTVHHAAPLAIEADVPLIHFPMGTENLFAREFGLKRSPRAVLEAIRRATLRRVDIGQCNGRTFLLMGSIGFDACVVERVAASRRGGISRATYLRHSAAELYRPRFVRMSVRVDGRELVCGRAGMVLVANSRHYAGRLNPARNASMSDGALDVIFLPMESRIDVVRRGMQVLLGSQLHDRANLHAQGSEVTIIPETAAPLQLDGEHAGVQPVGQELRFAVQPGVLSVFTP